MTYIHIVSYIFGMYSVDKRVSWNSAGGSITTQHTSQFMKHKFFFSLRNFNHLTPKLFLLILAHPVYKM